MAVNLLDTAAPTPNASTRSSGAFTPTANAVMYAFISVADSAIPSDPTCTGHGVTWTKVEGPVNTSGDAGNHAWLFQAVALESPTLDTVDWDFGGNTNANAKIIVVEVTNPGVTPTVQSNDVSDGSGTTIAGTLSAFADALKNIALGFFFNEGDFALTKEAAHTQLANLTEVESGQGHALASYMVGQDTSLSCTQPSAVAFGCIVVEVAVADTGDPAVISQGSFGDDVTGVVDVASYDPAATQHDLYWRAGASMAGDPVANGTLGAEDFDPDNPVSVGSLTGETPYFWQVVSTIGGSPVLSNEISFTTAPKRVTALAAEPGDAAGEVDVTWTDESSAETAQLLMWRVNGSGDPYDAIELDPNLEAHTLVGLAPGETYQINLLVENANGLSGSDGAVTSLARGGNITGAVTINITIAGVMTFQSPEEEAEAAVIGVSRRMRRFRKAPRYRLS